MKNFLYKIYALYCYAIGGISIVAFVLFFENILLPKTVSLPLSENIDIKAIFIDLFLIVLFGLQHSLMARDWFKDFIKSIIPPKLERVTYILITGFVLAVIIFFWQPFGLVLFDLRGSVFEILFYGISLFGLVISGIGAISINPRHFIGWSQINETVYPSKKLVKPLLHRIVRHPIYLGFLIAIWSTPLMTTSHLLFAGLMTVYIDVGIFFEERNLVKEFGSAYIEYQLEVPKLLPFKFPFFRR